MEMVDVVDEAVVVVVVNVVVNVEVVVIVTVAVVVVDTVVVDVVDVPVIVVVDVVVMHVPHKVRHRSRTFRPTALPSWHEAATNGSSWPHSAGSAMPWHSPVVVEVVAVVVVVVTVVVVVDAMHELHATGQSARRSANAGLLH